MRKRRERGAELKTPEQLAAMWEAGQVVAGALRATAAAVAPGVTTADLDDIAAARITDAGAVSSFLGYHDYPATICVSINEQIVHGIPGTQLVLRPGDVVSIDCGASVRGWSAHFEHTVAITAAGPWVLTADHVPAAAAAAAGGVLVRPARASAAQASAALAPATLAHPAS